GRAVLRRTAELQRDSRPGQQPKPASVPGWAAALAGRAVRRRNRSPCCLGLSTGAVHRSGIVMHENAMTAPKRRFGHQILELVAALPLFATAPLYRHWHLRWGATDAEVRAAMPGD